MGRNTLWVMTDPGKSLGLSAELIPKQEAQFWVSDAIRSETMGGHLILSSGSSVALVVREAHVVPQRVKSAQTHC